MMMRMVPKVFTDDEIRFAYDCYVENTMPMSGNFQYFRERLEESDGLFMKRWLLDVLDFAEKNPHLREEMKGKRNE
jgi:hypothetical protein